MKISVGTSHMMREKNYQSVNLKKLKRVLHFDPQNRYIVVEPGITMEALVEKTVPYGLSPPVIPEFKGITVGGAISGASLESSSHLYGQFNDTCLSYEILTADGQILQASPDENPELYYAVAGSYGTLGAIISVKIQLIPIKSQLKLTYRKFLHHEEALDFLTELNQSKSPPDFMEAIVFPKKTVAILATYISKEEAEKLPKIRLREYYDPWFYSHVDQTEKLSDTTIDLIDYLFRHDRGAFWMGGYSLHPGMLLHYLADKGCKALGLSCSISPKFCKPKNPGWLFRTLFGGLTGSQRLYQSLHFYSEEWFKKHFVIQDFYLPKEGAKQFVSYVLKHYEITPLWICPIRSTTTPQLLSPHYNLTGPLAFDIGVYGIPCQKEAPKAVRDLEDLVYRLDGKKMFYSHNYLTKEQFWSQYSEASYQALRKKYRAESTPDIIDKVLDL